jgi:hypothetical protein
LLPIFDKLMAPSLEVFMTKHQKQPAVVCALCGSPIPPARLEALPGVTLCINCAKKHPPRIDIRKFDLSQSSPINRNGFAPTD